MRKIFPSAVAAIAAFAALATPARADQPRLTGMLYEHIDPTAPLSAVFIPGVGASASPHVEGDEMADALRQFTDMGAAMAQLEALKRKDHYSGGRVFMSFFYSADTDDGDSGKLETLCGVSNTTSKNWDEVRAHMTTYGLDPMEEGSFSQFKDASRADRVRSIARCLAELPGMPPLKPVHPDIKAMYIDPAIYAAGEAWLRAKDPKDVQGTQAQYRKAFECVVAMAAREMPNAVDGNVVFRMTLDKGETEIKKRDPAWLRALEPSWASGYSTEYEEWTSHSPVLAVVGDRALKRVLRSSDGDEFDGIWDVRSGFEGVTVNGISDPLEQALKPGLPYVQACRRQAGLFEIPDTKLPDLGATAHCAGQ